MVFAAPAGALGRLRQALATLDKERGFAFGAETSLSFGLPALDAILGGGLPNGALHELAPATPAALGSTSGFALALAALQSKNRQAVLILQTDFAAAEAGAFYGIGLDGFGLPMERLILVRLPRAGDVLWAFEEALKSRGVAITIAELPAAGEAADFTATRRLTLAARTGGGLGLLLRQSPLPLATAAATRWQVAAAPSRPDRFGGLGRTVFDLSLNRNRRGRCGRFILCWDHHACVFLPQTFSVGVATTAGDGSPAPRIAAFG